MLKMKQPDRDREKETQMSKIEKPNATGLAARAFTRRIILKTTVIGAAGAITAPWIVQNAFSSSGSVNFMGWAGYDFKAAFAGFNKATGITVNFNEQPEQDTMFAQCKLALQTGAVECVEPTIARMPGWVHQGIIQPWDTGKLTLSNYIQSTLGGANGEM